MSSLAVRQLIKTELDAWAATSGTPWFNLSDYVSNIDDLPDNRTDPFVMVQYVGGYEDLNSLADGSHGFMEQGVIYLHIVVPTGFNQSVAHTIADTIMPLLSNRRLGHIVLEPAMPLTDQRNIAIRLSGGWHGWSTAIGYYRINY